jgi:hypothetical protein
MTRCIKAAASGDEPDVARNGAERALAGLPRPATSCSTDVTFEETQNLGDLARFNHGCVHAAYSN